MRERIVDRMLRWSAVVTLIPCVAGVALAVDQGLWSIVVLDTVGWGAIAAAAVGRRWPYRVRAAVLLVVFGAVGAGVLVALGPFGVGLLWLLGLPAAAAILTGARGFWIAEGVVLAVLLGVGLGARSGVLTWAGHGVPPLWWILAAFSIVSVSLLVGLSTSVLTEGLEASLREVRAGRIRALEANRELEAEIGSRQQAERERALLQDQLVFAQKMELVGQLAGGVAHDLNNVLTVVQVEGNRARSQVPHGSEPAESLDNLLAAASSAASLCAKLVLFSRRQSGNRALVRLDTQLQALEPLLRSLAGERVHVHLALGAPDVSVRAEPVELEQVLTNLVANARDALSEGGDVWIETRPVDDERGPQVQIEVRDAGPGIEPALLGRLFEPFFTTRPEGTGLGLATVYALVRSLGGSVSVDSQLGAGATFRVVVPKASGGAPRDATPPQAAGRLPGTTRTVLLVEDNPQVRPVLARLLRHLGCRVVAVGSVREALAVFDTHPPPDLVLTDVLMPDRSGVDLAEALRERLPSLPILAMSGWLGDGEFAVRLAQLGVPVLQKPFTPEGLARALAEGLGSKAANS